MKQVPLSEEDLLKRRDVLVARIAERDKIDEQKSAQNQKWNEQLRLLDGQISTIATEIRDKTAWIPAQLTGGEAMGVPPDDDDAVEADDTVDELSQRRARKAGKRAAKKTSKRAPRAEA
jgi:hypothetical protein